MKNWHNRS